MTGQVSALFSHYIIDGARQDTTPAELLAECMEDRTGDLHTEDGYCDIIDETPEPPIASFIYDDTQAERYMRLISDMHQCPRNCPVHYPEHFTKLKIAATLLDMIWLEGHFRLGNLRIRAGWDWDTSRLGNMSAFYNSVCAASGYLYDLGVRLAGYSFREGPGRRFIAEAFLPENTQDTCRHDETALHDNMPHDDFFGCRIPFRLPYESRNPWIGKSRRCSGSIIPEENSGIIYIPFDTGAYRLGGSMLSEALGNSGGGAAACIHDPDYFIDCYEVIRELAEDGIIMSGVTVSEGGLMAAADRITAGCAGIRIDMSGIMSSYGETCATRILFGEVPGVLVQVADTNYDYFDSQLLLQDVAYYPLGRPSQEHGVIRICKSSGSGISGILAALLVQASEGED